MSDTLKAPSSHQLRAELHEMVRKDLLGPAGGPTEEVDERNVRGRYIVGLLAPSGQSLLPDEQDDLAVDGLGDDQNGKTDTVVPQMVSMLPSALGLTFSLDGAAENIQVTARWGRYRRVRSEIALNDKGEPRRVWKRQPVERQEADVNARYDKLRKERDKSQEELETQVITDQLIEDALSFQKAVKEGLQDPTWEDKRYYLEQMRFEAVAIDTQVRFACYLDLEGISFDLQSRM